MLKKLVKIESLLDEAQELYDNLPEKEKENILNFHNEQYSIPYCLRWGIQAIEEINDDILQRLSDGEKYQEMTVEQLEEMGYIIEKVN